jgi:hypothetical protein
MAIGILLMALWWTAVAAGISFVNLPRHKMTANSSIIAVVNAESEEDCIVHCVTTPGCLSVSVLKASNVCQMNNATLSTHDASWDTWSPKQAVADKTTPLKSATGKPDLCLK